MVSPSLPKERVWEAQGKCLHHLVSLWYSQINHSKNMSYISGGVSLIFHNSVT